MFQTMMMMHPANEGLRDNLKAQKQMPPIHSFFKGGMPVYFFQELGGKHCYWDVCDCGDCDVSHRKKRKEPLCSKEAKKDTDPKPDIDVEASLSILQKKKVLPCYKPILNWVKKQKWENPEEIRECLKDMMLASISERLVHKMEHKGKIAANPQAAIAYMFYPTSPIYEEPFL
ncbi:hypothetical protein CDL15_Pgr017069 [Punica granatum]|uniref:Uncharacterized protein n=1 Tax=Punica granatum TaxID=22663 RepID=A0A218WYS4_PUNGR|nr:hypothetical protein CDL15_Pgr017069 [Punica granatum]